MSVGPYQERSFQGTGVAETPDRVSSGRREVNGVKGNELGGREDVK